jgi:hypothetical protein
MAFTIFALMVNWSGKVEHIAVPGTDFADRKEAVKHVEALVHRFKPSEGYDAQKGCWWATGQRGLTRYTIEAQHNSAES